MAPQLPGKHLVAPPRSGPGSPTAEDHGAPVKITFARQASFNRVTKMAANQSEVTDFQVHEVESLAVIPTAAPSMQMLMGDDYRRRVHSPPSNKFAGHHGGFAVPLPLGTRGTKATHPVSRASHDGSRSASRSGADSPDAFSRAEHSPFPGARPGNSGHSGRESPARWLAERSSSSSVDFSVGKPQLSWVSSPSRGGSRVGSRQGGGGARGDERDRCRTPGARLDVERLQGLSSSMSHVQLADLSLSQSLAYRPEGLYTQEERAEHIKNRPTTTPTMTYRTKRLAACQLGIDGYGGDSAMMEEIDRSLNRPDSRLSMEALKDSSPARPRTTAMKKRIKESTLKDGFSNSSTIRIIEKMFKPQHEGIGIKYPLVSRNDLLIEQAEDARHDNPSYKRQPCGYAQRGEEVVFGWAAPYNFRVLDDSPKPKGRKKAASPPPSRPASQLSMASSRPASRAGGSEPPEGQSEDDKSAMLKELVLDRARKQHQDFRFPSHAMPAWIPLTRLRDAWGQDVVAEKARPLSRPKTPLKIRVAMHDPGIQAEHMQIATKERPSKGAWTAGPNVYPGVLVGVDKRFAFREQEDWWDKKHSTKKDFAVPTYKRRQPGAERPIGQDVPPREVMGRFGGPYKAPSGVFFVRPGGLGFRPETPGM